MRFAAVRGLATMALGLAVVACATAPATFVPDPKEVGANSSIETLGGVETIFVKGARVDLSVGLRATDALTRDFVVLITNKTDRPVSIDEGGFSCAAETTDGQKPATELLDRIVTTIYTQYGPSTIVSRVRPTSRGDIVPGGRYTKVLEVRDYLKSGETELWRTATRYRLSLPIGDEVFTLAFRVESPADIEARRQKRAESQQFVGSQIPAVANGTIRVDGSVSDWAGVQPIIVDAADDSKGPAYTDLKAVYIAADGQYVYARFDLREPAKYASDIGAYAVAIAVSKSRELVLEAYYFTEWRARVVSDDPARRGGQYFAQLSGGTVRWSGSSLEARFNKSDLDSAVTTANIYSVSAWTSIPSPALAGGRKATSTDPATGGGSDWEVADTAAAVSVMF